MNVALLFNKLLYGNNLSPNEVRRLSGRGVDTELQEREFNRKKQILFGKTNSTTTPVADKVCDWCSVKILPDEPEGEHAGRVYHKSCLQDLWEDKLGCDAIDYGEDFCDAIGYGREKYEE